MDHSKFPSLTGLRGLLALIVVFEHISDTLSAQFDLLVTQAVSTNFHFLWTFGPVMLIRNGAFAVGVFFALSGFVLTHAFCRYHNLIGSDFLRWLLKRYLRFTLPVLAIHISIWIAFQFEIIHQGPSWLSTQPGFSDLLSPMLDLNLANTFYHGLIATPLLGVAHFNPVLWTIAVEFYGGVLVLLIIACWRNSLPKYGKLILGSLVGGSVLLIFHQTFFMGFIVGSWTYLVMKNIPLRFHSIFKWLCLIMFCFLILHTAKGGNSNPFNVLPLPMHTLHHYVYYSLAGCCLIIVCINAPLSHSILCAPPLNYLGQRSFSLYLVHYPIIDVFGKKITWFLDIQQGLGIAEYMGIILILSFVLAEAFYVTIERPTLHAIKATIGSGKSRLKPRARLRQSQ